MAPPRTWRQPNSSSAGRGSPSLLRKLGLLRPRRGNPKPQASSGGRGGKRRQLVDMGLPTHVGRLLCGCRRAGGFALRDQKAETALPPSMFPPLSTTFVGVGKGVDLRQATKNLFEIALYWRIMADTPSAARMQAGAALSPPGFEHINVLGRYAFILPDTMARGELRPFRGPASASTGGEEPILT